MRTIEGVRHALRPRGCVDVDLDDAGRRRDSSLRRPPACMTYALLGKLDRVDLAEPGVQAFGAWLFARRGTVTPESQGRAAPWCHGNPRRGRRGSGLIPPRNSTALSYPDSGTSKRSRLCMSFSIAPIVSILRCGAASPALSGLSNPVPCPARAKPSRYRRPGPNRPGSPFE